jgi:hypothetical protein
MVTEMLAALLAVASPAGRLLNLATGPIAPRVIAPRTALSPRKEGGLLHELPSEPLLHAVQQSGGRLSAADVAAAAGLDLMETRRAMLVLARLVGADLQVSPDGEILFVFGDDVRGQLRRASWKARAGGAWKTASVPVMRLLRASFGVTLFSSFAIAVIAIAILLAAISADDIPIPPSHDIPVHPSHGTSHGGHASHGKSHGGSPSHKTSDRGFPGLRACFSFLFGDGNPNADLRERCARPYHTRSLC